MTRNVVREKRSIKVADCKDRDAHILSRHTLIESVKTTFMQKEKSRVLCKINHYLRHERPNGHQFPDDNFKCIFLNENIYKFRLSFHWVFFQGTIISLLVQIMAWRRPLQMMVSLLTHLCVIRPQRVKIYVNMIKHIKNSAPLCQTYKPTVISN